MSTAKIFSYRGVIGATTDIENGEFLNDINGPSQLGCVIKSDLVDITKEAKEIIRKAPREGGSFAPIMLTTHEGEAVETAGKSSVCVMGFRYHMFSDTSLRIGRECDLSVLDDCNEVEMDIPEDFKDAVNILLDDIKS